MANSITITGGKGDFGLKSYIPQLYSPKLREKFWHNTILRKITNTEFKGQFKNKGDRIIVRCMPDIATSRYVDGMKITYQKPESYDIEFQINKGLYYAFVVSDVQQAFSDIPNWANKWTDDGGKQLAQDWETWFFKDICSGTKCDAFNRGKNAGAQSGSYNLGESITAPVSLYKSDSAASGGTAVGTGDKTTAVELVTRLAATLDEQKGGAGATKFAILPVWMMHLLQNSEVFQDASKMGDDSSILRKDAVTSVGKIGGLDIYTSNLLPKTDLGGGRYEYPIFFGDNSAITFADEVSITEVLRDKSVVGDFHRSLQIADWFVRYSERFGVAHVVKGA